MNRINDLRPLNPFIDAHDRNLLACMRHGLITILWDQNGNHLFIPTRYGETLIRKGTMLQMMEHAATGASEDAEGNPRPMPNEDYWTAALPERVAVWNKN
jgi:hypothetical protein